MKPVTERNLSLTYTWSLNAYEKETTLFTRSEVIGLKVQPPQREQPRIIQVVIWGPILPENCQRNYFMASPLPTKTHVHPTPAPGCQRRSQSHLWEEIGPVVAHWEWVVIDWRESPGTFCADGNFAYLNRGAGYMCVYIIKPRQVIHFTSVHFALCEVYLKSEKIL